MSFFKKSNGRGGKLGFPGKEWERGVTMKFKTRRGGGGDERKEGRGNGLREGVSGDPNLGWRN